MERDCESELSKLNIEQNACIYHLVQVIHGQRSNILRLRMNTFFIIKQLFIHSQIDEKALSGDSLFFYVSVILFLKKERFTYEY